MNAYFWVMQKQKVMNKAYHFYEKTKKSVILIRDVIFNEAIMVLKKREPIIDAYVYDPIEGQNEGFMPLAFEIDKHIPIPLVIPIPLIMGSLGVSFFTSK